MNRFLIVASLLMFGSTAWAQDEWEESTPPAESAPEATASGTTAPAEAAEAAPTGSFMQKGTKGLFFAVPSGGGPTFGAGYFLSADAQLRFEFGLSLSTREDPATGDRANQGGFSLEALYRMYKPVVGKLTWFIQPGLFVSKTPGIDFGDALNLALTGALGVEYWFGNQWSLSGSTGVALQFQNKFKDVIFTTGTSALQINFYWR